MKEEFSLWMTNLTSSDGKPLHKVSTVKKYVRALEKVCNQFTDLKIEHKNLFLYTTVQSFEEASRVVRSNPEFESINTRKGRGDLSAGMHKYLDFLKDYSRMKHETDSSEKEEIIWKSVVDDMTDKELLKQIKTYIEAQGFSFDGNLIENYYLSMKSKPFVILAGTSGTGKTRLVRLFAEAIGATSSEDGGNGRYKLISVRPDWSDSTDLFGHTNLQGEFVPGAITDFVNDASKEENLNKPYFLCLDEMNLARVEYYLSDFLSVIETRKRVGGRIKTDEILMDAASAKKYPHLTLPENLYIIGTVNMDETTFPFSKKVLDRANTIEFSYVDLIPTFEEHASEMESLKLDNSFFKTDYIILKQDVSQDEREFVVEVCIELQEINEILQRANAHVGYRVRDEIVFYMLNNRKADLLNQDEAFDNEIMQKVLPRIQGSGDAVKELLEALFKKFAGDYTGLSQDSEWKQMKTFIDNKGCKYQKSAEKICYMMRRYEEDGFTSYWL